MEPEPVPLRERRPFRAGVSVFAAALLLFGIGVEIRRRGPPDDAALHHERVRRAAESSIPFSFGPWIGRDVDPVAGTEDILHPNVLVQRDYENIRTGERVSVLFVQSLDARDLLGHYPPVCYPAHGLVSGPAVAMDAELEGRRIPHMRYAFSRTDIESASGIAVDAFLVVPGGGIVRDMASVDQAAADARRRHLGAAQFQVVTDASLPSARRDEIFREFVGRTLPLLLSLTSSPDVNDDR